VSDKPARRLTTLALDHLYVEGEILLDQELAEDELLEGNLRYTFWERERIPFFVI